MQTTNTTGSEILIHVNEISVCYDDLGQAPIPIIFIHGFPFDKTMWQPQLDFFKSSQRVIAYDIRGFGKSTSDNETASMNLYADDLIKFMDLLEIDKAIVCGLSMGGYILLNAVNRYPEKFAAIILSDTQCIADSAEAKEKRYKSIAQIIFGGLENFAEAFVKNIFCNQTLASNNQEVERIKKIILSTSSDTMVAALSALANRWEMCSTLSDIKIPTLILCGSDDAITPLAQSEFMQSKIKNAVLRTIKNAGHLSNLENPLEFSKQINDFVLSLELA